MHLTMANLDLVQTKNPLLQQTARLVGQFNTRALPTAGAPPDKALLELLHGIVLAAGTYLTSKPPQPNAKNARRWDGLKDLVEQVGALVVRCGGRLVNGPADFRAINQHAHSYWLEALDPLHRAGNVLADRFASWRTHPHTVVNKTSFWDFLNLGSGSSVAYLDEAGRARFRQEMNEKAQLVSTMDGDEFCTEKLKTHFSGLGWAIFVVSPTGEFYGSSHVVGQFHHSSFLGGRPVMAAGEIVVEYGAVRAITAKSGHYRPTPANMMELVKRFPTLPYNAVIRPDMADIQNGGKANFYYLGDFRAQGLAKARRLGKEQVLAALPKWAKDADAMKTLNLIG